MSGPELRAACLVPGAAQHNDNGSVPARVCVIDLGTNSFHALIVDAFPNGTFTIVDRMKVMVHLGACGLSEGRLTEEGIRRALKALRRIRLLAEGREATSHLAFATSAVREAENGGDFIERVREQEGIRVRPISGAFEAALIYRGVRQAVDLPRPTLLIDIGGGSTEFIVADAQQTYFATSLKLGAARMTEHFITTDPLVPEEHTALRDHYRSALASVYEAVRTHDVQDVVGSSGTMKNLARVCANQEGKADRSIFQQSFEAAAMRRTTERITASSRVERIAMPGIDDRRVEQIVAGALLLDVVLGDVPIQRMRVSSYALREGMVDYFLEENYERLGYIAPFSSVRRRSIYELAFRFDYEEAHARHVTAMTLQLFDACRSLHGLGAQERELLEYASLLHDIGYHISPHQHHKHARYLIKHADLRGFTPEEIDTIAFVARYHRGALPSEEHSAFGALTPAHRRTIRQLAAFLRLANGLDRSHFQNVRILHTALHDGALTLGLDTEGDPELEVWGGRRAAPLFEEVFGYEVEITARENGHLHNGTAVRPEALLPEK